jgi:hypothetical protein
MRQIIAILIALLALAVIMPAMCAPVVTQTSQSAPLLDPAQTQLSTTSSIAAFIDDDWLPTSFTGEVLTSSSPDTKKKSTLQDINKTKPTNLSTTTYFIQDFLNDGWQPAPFAEPINTAAAAKKGGALKEAGYAIYQFLDDNWTPGEQIVAVSNGIGYAKHKMA